LFTFVVDNNPPAPVVSVVTFNLPETCA
jgi:hypothetical protein